MVFITLVQRGILYRIIIRSRAALICTEIPVRIRKGLILYTGGDIVNGFIVYTFLPSAILEGKLGAVWIRVAVVEDAGGKRYFVAIGAERKGCRK
jgi:hypothetical protein